jgi:hypothetical protein
VGHARTCSTTVRTTLTVLTLCGLGALLIPAPVQADTYYQFQSPSGNINCGMGSLGNQAFADCEITDHSWVAPPRPDRCEGAWGGRIALYQGTAPTLVCSSDTLRGSGSPTLSYGSTWPVNPITCDSELTGVTCTDASTGHYFRVSRDSYDLH